MLKIIITDDHPIVREGLKKVLEKSPEQIVIEEAGSGGELMSKVRSGKYDVVLLDVSLPDSNGLDLLEHLKREKPDLPVLVLSIHAEEHYAIRALKLGAGGYLNKDNTPNELLKAINKVVAGGKYISPAQAEQLVLSMDKSAPKAPHELLSDREFEVMCMIASGKTVSEIAAAMSLSSSTVSTYRARVLEKMSMHSNAELTYYAVKNSLVD